MQAQNLAAPVAAPAPQPMMAVPAAANPFPTIKQLAKVRDAFTEAALRDIAFRAYDRTNSRGEIIKGNGSGPMGVWISLGRKKLAVLERFDAWIRSHHVGAQK